MAVSCGAPPRALSLGFHKKGKNRVKNWQKEETRVLGAETTAARKRDSQDSAANEDGKGKKTEHLSLRGFLNTI